MSSTTRLLVLGVVKLFEPVHGYVVRRELISWRAQEWASVQPGSIYNALKTLTRDGLLEVASTDQVGGRPERTTYRLTTAGEEEFQTLLREEWWTVRPTIDPLMAAVSFLSNVSRAEAIAALEHRVAQIRGVERHIGFAIDAVDGRDSPNHVREMMRLMNARATAEIGWSEKFLERLRKGEYGTLDEPPWRPSPRAGAPGTRNRGRSDGASRERGRSGGASGERGRSDGASRQRGRSDGASGERGRSDGASRERSDGASGERGRSDGASRQRGRSDGASGERGRSDGASGERGRSDGASGERGRSDGASRERGRSDAASRDRRTDRTAGNARDRRREDRAAATSRGRSRGDSVATAARNRSRGDSVATAARNRSRGDDSGTAFSRENGRSNRAAIAGSAGRNRKARGPDDRDRQGGALTARTVSQDDRTTGTGSTDHDRENGALVARTPRQDNRASGPASPSRDRETSAAQYVRDQRARRSRSRRSRRDVTR